MAQLSKLTDPGSVLQAIAEFDRIGRTQFLKNYNFGRARDYFIRYEGRYYDSKAITAAAYGLQHPDDGPLTNKVFSGGRKTVKIALERLGIKGLEVVSDPFQFLVLAENEIYAQEGFPKWQDVTGERYHFPNTYINRVVPGREFVYYKSSRRNAGRVEPEYFGFGRIGTVYPDPESNDDGGTRKRWLCEIEDYHPFSTPIPFRDSEGRYLELGESSVPNNYWRVGVREISDANFYNILRSAGVSRSLPKQAKPQLTIALEIKEVSGDSSLWLKQKKRDSSIGSGAKFPSRRSGRAKVIGDRAEEIVMSWLHDRAANEKDKEKIIHVASMGETPGWDIEIRMGGKVVAYEVKGTTGTKFPNIQVTANEWRAAEKLGKNYNLVLVASCESNTPVIEVINDPWRLFSSGKLIAEATEFRIERIEK